MKKLFLTKWQHAPTGCILSYLSASLSIDQNTLWSNNSQIKRVTHKTNNCWLFQFSGIRMSLIATFLVVLLTIFPSDFCMSFVMFLIALVIPTFSAPFSTPPKNVCHPNPKMARISTPAMIMNRRRPNNLYDIIHKFLKYYVFCLQNISRYLPNMMIIIHDGPHDVPSYFWWYRNCFHAGSRIDVSKNQNEYQQPNLT